MSILKHHGKIERNLSLMFVFSLIAVMIGGIVEIAPLFYIKNTIEKVEGMRPYTPLELAGRDIYVREGTHFSGVQNEQAQTWRVLVDVTRMNGTHSI